MVIRSKSVKKSSNSSKGKNHSKSTYFFSIKVKVLNVENVRNMVIFNLGMPSPKEEKDHDYLLE